MVDGARDRVRVQLSEEVDTCPRCGRHELRLMRSRDKRSGLATVNPFWDAHQKTYQRCAACSFRRAADDARAESPKTAPRDVRPRSTTGEPHRVRTVLGWTAVVLMVVLIAVLTAVLAGMVLVVSVWLTVAVPLVVLLLVVGVAAFARRGS